MTGLLELRGKLRSFYGKYETYVAAGIRFLLAVLTFILINTKLGYRERLDNLAVPLLLAMVCTFLPANAIVLFGAVLILLHLSALSLEVCGVGLCLFLLMFFMYYKYAPKNAYSVTLTPILCMFHVPQVMPVASGLLQTPASGLAVLCGAVTYYYLHGVQTNVAVLSAANAEGAQELEKLRVILGILINNKEMYLVLAAFFVTTVVVYLIRRQSVNRAWRIALIAGNLIQLLFFIAGSYWLGQPAMIVRAMIGTVISVLVCLILEFFLYNLDYSRIEHVQFEDDEYYYFVKAVPKVYVSGSSKSVKQITPRKNTINRKELAQELDIDQELLE